MSSLCTTFVILSMLLKLSSLPFQNCKKQNSYLTGLLWELKIINTNCLACHRCSVNYSYCIRARFCISTQNIVTNEYFVIPGLLFLGLFVSKKHSNFTVHFICIIYRTVLILASSLYYQWSSVMISPVS